MNKRGVRKIEKYIKLGKADLHIHSNFSDGKPTPKEILEYVEHHTDLDVIAISDHDTMDGVLQAQKLMERKKYRFELVLGEEISAKEGHILGLFLKEAIPGTLPAEEVLKRIHTQGGIAIAAHPFEHTWLDSDEMVTMNGVGLSTLLRLGRVFDGLEIVNATPTLSDENLRASALNNTILFRAETGSSDAHILDAISKGYTLFEGKTAQDLKKALFYHQTRAMHAHWTIMALVKYGFFFLPRGLRMLFYTLFHGRRKKAVQS